MRKLIAQNEATGAARRHLRRRLLEVEEERRQLAAAHLREAEEAKDSHKDEDSFQQHHRRLEAAHRALAQTQEVSVIRQVCDAFVNSVRPCQNPALDIVQIPTEAMIAMTDPNAQAGDPLQTVNMCSWVAASMFPDNA